MMIKPSKIAHLLTLTTISVAVASCDDGLNSAEKLKGCLASTEQTVLLRKLALSGKDKQSFDGCRAMYGRTENYAVVSISMRMASCGSA
jgi:hypothetical protein